MAEFCNMTCGSALSSLGRVEYFSLETPETSRPQAFLPAVDGVRRAFCSMVARSRFACAWNSNGEPEANAGNPQNPGPGD